MKKYTIIPLTSLDILRLHDYADLDRMDDYANMEKIRDEYPQLFAFLWMDKFFKYPKGIQVDNAMQLLLSICYEENKLIGKSLLDIEDTPGMSEKMKLRYPQAYAFVYKTSMGQYPTGINVDTNRQKRLQEAFEKYCISNLFHYEDYKLLEAKNQQLYAYLYYCEHGLYPAGIQVDNSKQRVFDGMNLLAPLVGKGYKNIILDADEKLIEQHPQLWAYLYNMYYHTYPNGIKVDKGIQAKIASQAETYVPQSYIGKLYNDLSDGDLDDINTYYPVHYRELYYYQYGKFPKEG